MFCAILRKTCAAEVGRFERIVMCYCLNIQYLQNQTSYVCSGTYIKGNQKARKRLNVCRLLLE